MAQPKYIFETSDLSDLPDSIKKHYKEPVTLIHKDKIMELFDIKGRLTLKEIVIGIYRTHLIVMTPASLSHVLKLLLNENLINKVGRGTYAKVINVEDHDIN